MTLCAACSFSSMVLLCPYANSNSQAFCLDRFLTTPVPREWKLKDSVYNKWATVESES